MVRPRQKGFTLIEVLVAVTVFATAIALVASITTSSLRAVRRSTANKRLNSAVRDFNNLLANKVRSARIINYGTDHNQVTLSYTNGTTENITLDANSHKLVLSRTDYALPDITAYVADGASSAFVVDESGTLLTLKLKLKLSGADEVETDYVTSLARRN